MSPRTRNNHLVTLLTVARWSFSETARQINLRAMALGHRGVAVDKSRVSRWIAGERPRPPVGQILAEVLGEHLGRHLSPAHLGLADSWEDPLAPGWSADTMVESLQTFTGSDLMLDRRDMLTFTLGVSLAATTTRLWNLPPAAPSAGTAHRFDADTLDQLEILIRHWRAADDTHGGALFCSAVVAQLHAVAQNLNDQPHNALTTRLYTIVADLAGLAGWMSHDIEKFGSAQRYWTFGLMAAREAGQHGRGAELISRMAHQMMYFGRPADALDLLDVADRAAAGHDNQRLRAMLTAQRGRMLAATGNGRHSQYSLAYAADLLATAEQQHEPVPDWIAYFSAAELAGATAVSRRDLREQHDQNIGLASTAFADAVTLREPRYRRCRAMDLVGQAAALLTESDPQQACTVAQTALSAAGHLDSALIRSRILTLTDAAGPFQHHPDVLSLRDQIHPWTGPSNIPAA